jgi:DNA-directed RNA polymerase subunit RPC12/RpoP
MKKVFSLCALFVIAVAVCSSCKHVGKYADDVAKYADDIVKYGDDAYRIADKIKENRDKNANKPKTRIVDCPYCDVGCYWYNGYQFQCTYCGGKGLLVEQL